MDADLISRVQNALHDAERWTAKYIADNRDRAAAGNPLHAAIRALDRIGSVRAEISRLSPTLTSGTEA